VVYYVVFSELATEFFPLDKLLIILSTQPEHWAAIYFQIDSKVFAVPDGYVVRRGSCYFCPWPIREPNPAVALKLLRENYRAPKEEWPEFEGVLVKSGSK
jgi:hypothetical protein